MCVKSLRKLSVIPSKPISSKYDDDRLQRYAAMPRELQLGNLASNLCRVSRYIEKRRPVEMIREITREARDFVDIISCHQPDTLAICVAVDAYLDAVLLADYPELTSLGRIS